MTRSRRASGFARDHGDLPKGADPAALAMLASATLHTLAIRSRAGASRSTLEAMADATVHLICGPPPRCTPWVKSTWSFSSDRRAADALGMSASLRKRPLAGAVDH